eukprot:6456682-Amphidinium_carterae.1
MTIPWYPRSHHRLTCATCCSTQPFPYGDDLMRTHMTLHGCLRSHVFARLLVTTPAAARTVETQIISSNLPIVQD